MAATALVIGGSGQIGRAVAARLADAGWNVALADRGSRELPDELRGRPIRRVRVDRNAPGTLAEALGAGSDLVVDTIAYDAGHGRQLLSLAPRIGSLIVISSAAVYADGSGRSLDDADERGFPELPAPIPEAQSTVAPSEATYATRKAALEAVLLGAEAPATTVIRPCAVHGPGSGSPREWYFLKRALDRRPIVPIAYGARSLFHTTSVANLAELVRVAADRPATRVLNCGDPEPPTVGRIAEMILGWAGWDGAVLPFDGPPPAEGVGDTPWSTPHPFLLDMGAAGALGYRPAVSYAEAVGATCHWLHAVSRRRDWRRAFPGLAAYGPHLFDYEAEDRYLSGRADASA